MPQQVRSSSKMKRRYLTWSAHLRERSLDAATSSLIFKDEASIPDMERSSFGKMASCDAKKHANTQDRKQLEPRLVWRHLFDAQRSADGAADNLHLLGLRQRLRPGHNVLRARVPAFAISSSFTVDALM